MGNKLTPKQKAIVRSYTTNGGNRNQTAIDTGCCRKTVYRNLQKPEVKKAIEENEKKLDAKIEEKMMCTVESLFREMEDLSMKCDSECNRSVQAKLIELKGKLFGLFVDNKNITLSQPPLSLVEVVNSKGEVVDVGNKKNKTS